MRLDMTVNVKTHLLVEAISFKIWEKNFLNDLPGRIGNGFIQTLKKCNEVTEIIPIVVCNL